MRMKERFALLRAGYCKEEIAKMEVEEMEAEKAEKEKAASGKEDQVPEEEKVDYEVLYKEALQKITEVTKELDENKALVASLQEDNSRQNLDDGTEKPSFEDSVKDSLDALI